MKKWLFYIAFLISLIFVVINILDVNSYIEQRNKESLFQGQEITKSIANHIDSLLKQIMDEGKSIAAKISSDNLKKPELLELIKSRSEKHNPILGITAAFEPNTFDKNTNLYAPYYDKNQNKFIFIEDVYNYTDKDLKTSQWYIKVINNGSKWIEPYFAQGAKTLVVDYGTPIID